MIYCFNGQAGAGKDESVRRIQHLVGDSMPVIRVGFADVLKKSIMGTFALTWEQVEAYKRDDDVRVTLSIDGEAMRDYTFRQFIQRVGTEGGRGVFGLDFWENMALPLNMAHDGRIVCFADARFPSEVQRARNAGAKVIRVNTGALSGDAHPSEQVIDDNLIDYEIYNDKRDDGFAYLDAQLLKILENDNIIEKGAVAHAAGNSE